MLVWGVYIILVSTVLSLAAFMLERTALLRRMPTRWVWTGSIIACLLFPVIISSVSLPLPSMLERNVPAPAVQSLPLRQMTSTALSPALWLNDTVGPADTGTDINNLLQRAWFVTSAIMLLALLTGITLLHLRTRNWTRGTMCDAPVYIAEDAGPAIVGLFRPRIVVPRWLTSCAPEDQSLVILHETSHLQARDAQLLALVLLLIASMPWNLPLWWQLKRLRFAIEVDCDARVLQRGQDVSRYGNVLITVGARQSSNIITATAMSESGSFLEHRINHMLSAPRRTISFSVITAACLAICFISVATQIRPPNAISTIVESMGIPPGTDNLDQYVGYYHVFGDVVITITRNGDQLSAGTSGQSTVPIFPSAPGQFSYKIGDLKLTFILSAQRQVSGIILHQDGSDFTFKRIDAATAKYYADALARKVQSQRPDPRSRAILLRTIKSIANDKPDYTGMPHDQAALAQKNIFENKKLVQDIANFTDIDALKFFSVSPGGGDVYELKQGPATWYFEICLDQKGQVIAFNPWVRRDE